MVRHVETLFSLFVFSGNPDMYFYLNQGEAPYIDGVDDAEEFSNTRDALSTLGKRKVDFAFLKRKLAKYFVVAFKGINEKRQLDIFRVVSGILHMGNIMYQEGDNDSCSVPVRAAD